MTSTHLGSAFAPFDLSAAVAVVRNPDVDELYRDGLAFDGDRVAANGALLATTGKYTGRTPKDKFVVETPDVAADVWWENNGRMTRETYAGLRAEAQAAVAGRKLYVVDAYAGADPANRISVRFVVARPYHALFVKQLLIRPAPDELAGFEPDWTVVDLGTHKLDPVALGVRSEAAIALNFQAREILIFGTEYAGEMKKSIFSVMNLLLPRQGVMSMHCSANVGARGDVALFFGLSGTGKTTLSADPARKLIGDDEHGWSDRGVFNIEGGCYAKCIKLTRSGEPEIWDAIRRGAVLENVVLRPDGAPDYDDASLTENTRAAYPLEHIPNRAIPSLGGHPENVFFLTCDALGVLPPIAKLDSTQAMELFLIGYTAKLAGTEVGVVEPALTFSACFGAPFLPLPPKVYANLLGEKFDRHRARTWLVNTGWTGGGYGTGRRIDLALTRAMLDAALGGALEAAPYRTDPVFGLRVPLACPGVPAELLDPRATWADPDRYDAKAAELKAQFDGILAGLRAQ